MSKTFKIILLVFVLLTMFVSFTYAKEDEQNEEIYFRDGDITKEDIDYYRPSSPKSSDYDDVAKKIGSILGVIQVIGTIVSVAVLMILGIKFMMGSVEEKAEYKRSFIPYLIGVAILFSGTSLPNMIFSWTHNTLG